MLSKYLHSCANIVEKSASISAPNKVYSLYVSTVREYIKKRPFFYNICTGMQIFDVSNTVWC